MPITLYLLVYHNLCNCIFSN